MTRVGGEVLESSAEMLDTFGEKSREQLSRALDLEMKSKGDC